MKTKRIKAFSELFFLEKFMTLDQAKKLLDKKEMLTIEDNLFSGSEYVFWRAGDNTITLDGKFDADLLMAIAIWIKHINEM